MLNKTITALLFFFIITNSLLFCTDNEQHPTIKIKDPYFNFGNISQGTKVKHDFIVLNTGNQPLQITKIIPSCGCTAGTLTPPVIEAGQSGALQVEFDTTSFVGPKKKYITLITNDPINDEVELSIEGNIIAEVVVEPVHVYLPDVVKDKSIVLNGEAAIRITVSETSKTTLGEIVSFSEYFETKELTSQPKSKEILFRFKDSVPVGDFRENFSVKLENSSKPSLTIPIYANISWPLKLSQNIVSFGVVKPGQKLIKNIKLDNRSKTKLTKLKITSENPFIKVNSKEIVSGYNYVLEIVLDTNSMTSDLRTAIKLDNNITSEPLTFSVAAILPPK
jgi:hypothetical protein